MLCAFTLTLLTLIWKDVCADVATTYLFLFCYCCWNGFCCSGPTKQHLPADCTAKYVSRSSLECETPYKVKFCPDDVQPSHRLLWRIWLLNCWIWCTPPNVRCKIHCKGCDAQVNFLPLILAELFDKGVNQLNPHTIFQSMCNGFFTVGMLVKKINTATFLRSSIDQEFSCCGMIFVIYMSENRV